MEVQPLSDTRPPPPPAPSLESAAWFRAMLAELGETKGSMARFMLRNGDDRQKATILRNIERMANGEARVSGEMRVVLTMRANALKKRRKAEAANPAGHGRD